MTLRYDPGTVNMARLLRASLVTVLLAVTACGGSPSPSSPPPSGSGGTVTGRERFGWTQTAASPGDLASYRYAVYVDGARRVLDAVTCVASAPDSADCSAPLPSMTPGQHTLAIGTFITFGDTVLESSRSAGLQITVAASTAAGPAGAQSGVLVSSDGLELAAEILARDLTDPVDVAVDAAGRAFVAERGGVLRVIGPATDGSRDAIQRLPLARGDQPHVLSIALAPDFAGSRHVYVMHARPGTDGADIHLSRFRETAGTLGEAAVLASYKLADQDPAGVLRFGPDSTLYAGLGASTIADEAQQPGSYGGKILRLRIDGTTPEDNPRPSPVYTVGHRDPRGLAWHPSDGTLWEAEGSGAGGELNAIRAGANYGWAGEGERAFGALGASITLPAAADPSGLAIVGDRTSPLFGDLIVSSRGAREIFRFRVRSIGDRTALPPMLLQGRFGAIAQVHAGPDGALYFVTGNSDTWGAGHDLLVRLVPNPR